MHRKAMRPPGRGALRRLGAGGGLVALFVSLYLIGNGVTLALVSDPVHSKVNLLAAGTVRLTTSAITNCRVSGLLPGTEQACLFTGSYPGSVPAYLAADVLIETHAGSGGSDLYNPRDQAHGLVITISSSGPSARYTVPASATACPAGTRSGSACYRLRNELIATSPLRRTTVRFSIVLRIPQDSPARYQGGAAEIVLRVHAVQSDNNTLSCVSRPAAGSPCKRRGSFRWS